MGLCDANVTVLRIMIEKRTLRRLALPLLLTVALLGYYGFQMLRPRMLYERVVVPRAATLMNLKTLITGWQRELNEHPEHAATALERALAGAPAAYSSKSETEAIFHAFAARQRLGTAVEWLAPLPFYGMGLLLVRWRGFRYGGVAVLAASTTLVAACVCSDAVVRWLIPAGQAYVSDFAFLGESSFQGPSRDQRVVAFEKPPWKGKIAVAFGDGHVTWLPVEEFLELARTQGFQGRIPR